MPRVLFIDRAWPMIGQTVRHFAESVQGTDIQVLFLTDAERSSTSGNLQTISIFDVSQRLSLEELQAKYSFSLHKTLVPERAFYDYTSFRVSQCYSRLTEEQIAERVAWYANAFDYVIREMTDLVIEWFPDCFIPALAGNIARHYRKPFKMFWPYYWWNNGALFIDRMDLTSTEVDSRYRHYYDNPELCDRDRLDNIFRAKKTLFGFSSSEYYTFSMRVRQMLNRRKSYNPLSIRNWIVRRSAQCWSAVRIRALVTREVTPKDEAFLLFPLQVSPEASLLGTFPELADQFGLIKNISMNLPYGVKLYVKEHPYAELGLGLDYDFYRRLSNLPNVRIVLGTARLDQFIEHPGCLGVALVNGTLGLEAALKRKPVFVFGRTVYAIADCFLKPSNFEEFYAQLMSIRRGEYRFDERALYAILNALDASVVRADVDFLACPNSPALIMTFPAIWYRYVESRAWEKEECKLHRAGTSTEASIA